MIFFSLRGRFSSQCFFGSISSSLPTPHLFLMWTLWKWLKYEKVTYKAVFESEISSTKITLEIICFKGIFPKLFAPFSSSHGMGNLGSTTSFFLKKGDFVVFFFQWAISQTGTIWFFFLNKSVLDLSKYCMILIFCVWKANVKGLSSVLRGKYLESI